MLCVQPAAGTRLPAVGAHLPRETMPLADVACYIFLSDFFFFFFVRVHIRCIFCTTFTTLAYVSILLMHAEILNAGFDLRIGALWTLLSLSPVVLVEALSP